MQVLENPADPQTQEFLRSKRPRLWNAWLRLADRASPFFYGTGAEPVDNLVEVVRGNPAAATKLLFVTSLFSCAGNVISAASCGVFLLMSWQSCASCDRPLRWWLLLQALLQLTPLPVRIVLLHTLRNVEESGSNLEERIASLTSSHAWHISKKIAVFQYGWFVLGMVWWMHTNTCPDSPSVSKLMAAVMVFSATRALAAIGIFWMLFQEDNPREVPAAVQATKAQINAIPVFRFKKTNEEDAPCSICLSGFADGTLLRRLPCGHDFHRHCIDKWLRRNKRCPLCMTSIDHCPSSRCPAAEQHK